MAIIQAFHEGGFFMYFILAFGVLTFALIIERAYALYINTKFSPADFRARILDYIQRGDLKAAEKVSKDLTPKSSLGAIVEVGCHIRGNAGGEEEVQSRMDERLSMEISKIEKRTAFLAMFGNVATLLGLLGTISGMIHSFAAVANASPADRATLLSKGISEAMNCTAFGLVVAIPALVAYAVYQNRTDRLISQLTETTTQVFHDLVYLLEGKRAEV